MITDYITPKTKGKNMLITHIIDHLHGDLFTLTKTKNGETEVISREQAKKMHNSFVWQDTVFFTARADVQCECVPQHEVIGCQAKTDSVLEQIKNQ